MSLLINLLYFYFRKFPIRLGKIPVLRMFDRLGVFRNQVKTGRFGKNVKAELLLNDWVQQLVYFFGVYEFEKPESEAWCKCSSTSSMILDIGANFGYYSLLAVDSNPNAKVIAFEPAPSTFKRLNSNVNLNNLQNSINVQNLGVSDKKGVLPLFLATDDNSGMTSLTKPDSFSGEIVNVEIVAIDEFLHQMKIEQIDLVKIDVEGNEMNVLRGMKHIIETSDLAIFVELVESHLNRFQASVSDIFKFFREMDYSCYEFDRNGLLHKIENPKNIGLAIFLRNNDKKRFELLSSK